MISRPLAEILRPESIEDYIGQEKLMGEGGAIRIMIEKDALTSMILWGPPGVGKTTLALLLAKVTGRTFYQLSAINSGVKDVREVIHQASSGERPLLFIDEIHRFSKSQQDSLLAAVERGTITLIGATTENPSFEVISPLLSRCQVYVLESLTKEHLITMAEKAVAYYQQLNINVHLSETDALLRFSGGDARKLYNAFQLVVEGYGGDEIIINNENVSQLIQQQQARFDKAGEMHYDLVSAFIKSMRGSDPNAAVYWMARMIEGGEDPKFIARRMLILATEDIGLANPNALLMANACFDAVHKIGWPESRIILAECAVYLATSPKSNATYLAIDQALALVRKTGDLPVPLHLRNAPTGLMKDLGYGKDYRYAHDFDNNFAEQEYLPEKISGTAFYLPGKTLREDEIRRFLKLRWKDHYPY